ncbi:MAG: C4-dicarboxylate ABC transporter permease [Desulfobacterales bacterium]|nr:MAG: C4-dicarboxylate ABC transporter permease [Desulfobacterales bacterium]
MSLEILLVSLLSLFALNAPIAVAIGAAAVTAIAASGSFSLMMVVQRMAGGADSFHLMAVPLFMYAGLIMERGGISQRLIDFANSLVGWLPGGLAAVTVVSAMFFAGISGSAAADAAAVGAVLIPAMKKSGYDSDFAAAVQASGGAIGVIIPPSIPMIIFGFLTGASIGRLFAAGILPGLLIGSSLIATAVFLSRRHGYKAASNFSIAEVWRTFRRALLALGAPVIILGGILFGIFTATESAAVAVFYALIISLGIYRELSVKDLPRLITEGSVTAAVVMFIISTASVFSWLAAMEDLPALLAGSLLALTDHPVSLLLLINLLLLIAGTFVETTAALILLVPVITAMLPQLGISMIHLGVIVVCNLAIGMLTPPMGICLIVAGSISGDGITAVSRRVLPFLGILILDLLLISFWPPLSMWLAGMVAR